MARHEKHPLDSAPDRDEQHDADVPEPTHSERRLIRPSTEQEGARTGRVSVRPSAFGPPRRSVPPAAPAAVQKSVLPPAPARSDVELLLEEGESSAAWDMPVDESSPFKAAISRPAMRAQLAPIDALATPLRAPQEAAPTPAPQPASASVSRAPSSPRPVSSTAAATPASTPPPALQASVANAPAHDLTAKRTRVGIALFLGMIALGGVSLWRYLRVPEERHVGTPHNREREALAELDHVAASTERLAQASDAEVIDPAQVLEQAVTPLLAEGNRALDNNDAPSAERLFARVIELDEDNPRAAYGLARVRLSQNNLAGAEGWIQLAIRKRPRRAMYHALYAEILDKLGNAEAAEEERAHAQEP